MAHDDICVKRTLIHSERTLDPGRFKTWPVRVVSETSTASNGMKNVKEQKLLAEMLENEDECTGKCARDGLEQPDRQVKESDSVFMPSPTLGMPFHAHVGDDADPQFLVQYAARPRWNANRSQNLGRLTPPSSSPDGGRAGEDAAASLLQEMDWEPGTCRRLARTRSGTRAIDQVLRCSPNAVKLAVAKDFEGSVLDMYTCADGVAILLAIVANTSESVAGFVNDELTCVYPHIATLKHGHTLLREMLRQHWRGPVFLRLIDEVVACGLQLWRVRYATFVFQEVIRCGTTEHKKKVLALLVDDLRQRGSRAVKAIIAPSGHGEVESIFVVADALARCGELADHLALELAGIEQLPQTLVRRRYGNVLVKSALQFDGSPHAVEALRTCMLRALDSTPENEAVDFRMHLLKRCDMCRKCCALQCAACDRVARVLGDNEAPKRGAGSLRELLTRFPL